MTAISPRRLHGPWTDGYALDLHTVRSDFLGYDEYGHAQFDTERSEIGELLYKLKYRSDKSVTREIARTAACFVRDRQWSPDFVAAVPPSRSDRAFQPVITISRALAKELEIEFVPDCVMKAKETPQLKDVYDAEARREILRGAYSTDPAKVQGRTVLLFDDLYRSGATLSCVAECLKSEGKARSLYALTLTATRSNR